jgi:hypothetical protein
MLAGITDEVGDGRDEDLRMPVGAVLGLLDDARLSPLKCALYNH